MIIETIYSLNFADPIALALVCVLGITWVLSIVLKGYALWRASKNNQPWWFVALLIINTLGILEICYIWFVDRKKRQLNGV